MMLHDRKKSLSLALSILALVLDSCGSSDLDRSRAAALITRQLSGEDRATRVVSLSATGFQDGMRQRVWDNRGRPSERCEVAIETVRRDSIVLRTGAAPHVRVTGIAAGFEGVREAQFEWSYQSIPSILKRFVVEGGSGVATLRLFDDGWRVANLAFDSSSEPMELSSTESAELQAELERTAQSAKPTQTIKRFSSMAGAYPNQKGETVVTDVNFEFDYDWNNGGRAKHYAIWYGDLGAAKAGSGSKVVVDGIGRATGHSDLLRFVSPEERDAFIQTLVPAVVEWQEKYGVHSLGHCQ